MADRGLVVNARGAFPDTSELIALGPSVVRTIVYSDEDLDAALQNVPPGVKVVALLNGEHEAVGHDGAGWARAVERFAQRFSGLVWAVECWNEWDLLGISAKDACSFTRIATPILHDAGILSLHGSVAGPYWQEALTESANLLGPKDADGGCLHPYGQLIASMGPPQPGFGPGIAAAVQRASSLLGMPIYLTEFGAKLSDYGGEQRQAVYVQEAYRELDTLPESVCPVACFFAWHDAIGAPSEQGKDAFGLRRADGSQRPAWFAFQEVAGGESVPAPTPAPPQYVLGFAEVARAHPRLVGAPKENEWGPAQGISQQRSERGLLTWADLKSGAVITFTDWHDGKRYIWRHDHLEEVA